MHLSLDRSVAAVAVTVVAVAVVLLLAVVLGPARVVAEIWPNVAALLD